MCDEVFAFRLVKVVPKSLDVMANITNMGQYKCLKESLGDILDRHDANACQKTHKDPDLPEFQLDKQRKAGDV